MILTLKYCKIILSQQIDIAVSPNVTTLDHIFPFGKFLESDLMNLKNITSFLEKTTPKHYRQKKNKRGTNLINGLMWFSKVVDDVGELLIPGYETSTKTGKGSYFI